MAQECSKYSIDEFWKEFLHNINLFRWEIFEQTIEIKSLEDWMKSFLDWTDWGIEHDVNLAIKETRLEKAYKKIKALEEELQKYRQRDNIAKRRYQTIQRLRTENEKLRKTMKKKDRRILELEDQL